MEYISKIFEQLMQYNVALVIVQLIAICLISVICQGITKNLIKYAMPNKHKTYLMKKVIYPMLIIIQGGLIGLLLLTCFDSIAYQFVMGCIASFWSTSLYCNLIAFIEKKFNLPISKGTVITLVPGSNWDADKEIKEEESKTFSETPNAKKRERKCK